MAESDVYCNVVMNLDEINISSFKLFTLTFISPSFPLRKLGTFALPKLPSLWWGTTLFKMKSYFLEVCIRF